MQSFDVEAAMKYIIEHALPGSNRKCATHVREALEAGGIVFNGRILSAKDYDPALRNYGFKRYALSDNVLVDQYVCLNYYPKDGDIVVIQNIPGGSIHGHIAMYAKGFWYSDFKQIDMWGGPGYRKANPSVGLFRFGF